MTWTPGPLRYWLDINDSGTWGDDPAGDDGTPVVRSTDINLDGSWNLDDVALRLVPPADLVSKRLRAGDLIVVKSSGSAAHLGKTAIVDNQVDCLDACFANFVQRLRPSAGADARYIWYLLNSHRAAAEMEVLGNTTTGLRNLNGAIIGAVLFPGPPLKEQRAIADFLDTETARIDALITKKRRIIKLLRFKLDIERSRVLWSGQPSTVPLKHLTPADRPVMYGIVLPGPDVADGVSIIKGGDVAASLQRSLCRTTPEIERAYVRSRVRNKDLVFAIRGGIGDVAMVTEEIAGANLTQDVARVSPVDHVEPMWLLHVLRSPEVQAQVVQRTTGATIRGLNICDLKLIRVPTQTVEVQRSQSAELEHLRSTIEKAATVLTLQLTLLREHRQALITAAVTGELDVPGVAA